MPATLTPPTDSDSSILLITKDQAAQLSRALAVVLTSARRDPALPASDAAAVEGLRKMLGRAR